MEEIKISVDADRVLEACVRAILGGEYHYDDEEEFDGSHGFRAKMRKLVEDRIGARVDALVDTIATAEIEAMVRARIETVASDGFPTFDRDGRAKGVEPFAAYVRKAIDGMFAQKQRYGRASTAVTMAEEAFREGVVEAFKAETDAVRKRVRTYVDEQLSGAVVKALREAVGLRS